MWRVSGKNAGRGGLIGWDGVPDQIRGDEGEGSGGIMLAQRFRAWVSKSSNQGSRVVGEGLGGVDGLVGRHGWMEGWI